MKYWIIKTSPFENDLENMIKENNKHEWSIKSKIPSEMREGDVLFIWASTPIKRIVGKAECGLVSIEKSTFTVIYKTPYIYNNLTINFLRKDEKLTKSGEPSFLKRGPSHTIFPLNNEQGKRLDFLFNNNDTELIEDLSQIMSSEISETEKENLIKCRIGQGDFRKNLIGYWKGCSVTNNNNTDILIASHIKPWKDSSNEERLDIYNGLLLIPNLDKLFDRGYISFDDKGRILISKLLNNNFDTLCINKNMKIKIKHKHKKYLKYHRENIFQEQ